MNFDCSRAIKETLEFGVKCPKYEEVLNIAYGVDKNFMFGAAISITSVLINNKNNAIHFHLFTDYIDDKYIKCVQELVSRYQTHISIYIMSADDLKQLPCGNAWSYATYFRFIALDYLSDKINSVLYIDADVICKGSLEALNHIDFQGNVAAVIHDIDESRHYAAKRLNVDAFNESYFNAGVIFANLREWKAQGYLKTAFDMLMDKSKHFAFLDQDVLNIMFLGKVIFLPAMYNTIYGIKQELKSRDVLAYKEYIKPETVLIHYIGVTKPWNSWANYPSAQFFKDAYLQSPWSTQALIGPRTPKQYKKKSRHERLQGLYGASIVSYLGYLWAKLKQK